ncbi:response regulator [Halococcus salsus]|uniref:response regulator n=1 Tax=Halococcus salsus TaxID=2162894 RepID=UPI00135ACB77|nr:response regulator [Halococcus salsus]
MSSSDDVRGPIRVLHVDDEPGFCELVGLFLEREHDAIEVTTATSAEAGLERFDAADEPVDCVVSDYDMPGMNGLDFLERVRESNPDLPFVLFTGRGSEEIASEAITAGVNEYVEKRHGTEQYALLANRIDHLVGEYRAERELEATNERLRKLYSGITDAVFALDTERRFTYVNGRAEELLGQSEEELVGEAVEEEFSVLANTKFETEGKRAYRENEPVEFEEYYPPRGAWHRVRAVPTDDGLTVHLSDVTQRRARERAV